MSFEKFKSELEASSESVARVAYSLVRKGYGIRVPPLHVPETQDDGIPDEGDLFVIGKDGKERWIEVRCFVGSTEAMLHGFPCLIVERVERLDKNPPDFYYLMGSEMNMAFVMDVAANRKRFSVQKIRNGTDGRLVDCYMAPHDCFSHVKLRG